GAEGARRGAAPGAQGDHGGQEEAARGEAAAHLGLAVGGAGDRDAARARGLRQGARDARGRARAPDRAAHGTGGPVSAAVAVAARPDGGSLRKSALGAAPVGRSLAAARGGRCIALVAAEKTAGLEAALAQHGVDLVLAAEGPAFARPSTDAHVAAAAAAAGEGAPPAGPLSPPT